MLNLKLSDIYDIVMFILKLFYGKYAFDNENEKKKK